MQIFTFCKENDLLSEPFINKSIVTLYITDGDAYTQQSLLWYWLNKFNGLQRLEWGKLQQEDTGRYICLTDQKREVLEGTAKPGGCSESEVENCLRKPWRVKPVRNINVSLRTCVRHGGMRRGVTGHATRWIARHGAMVQTGSSGEDETCCWGHMWAYGGTRWGVTDEELWRKLWRWTVLKAWPEHAEAMAVPGQTCDTLWYLF